MTTVLCIGDPHFKVENIPEIDLLINRIENIALERKPDIIICLGDLLHTHERLHTTPLNKAYEFINKMRNITKTYVLVGNHDMCLGKDTPVLLWDGGIKMSQDIKNGDILIGDDGFSRKVQSICSGESELFLIKQKNANNYIVNKNHMLSLKCLRDKYVYWSKFEHAWIVRWLDIENFQVKTKYFGKIYQKNNMLNDVELKNEAEIYFNSIKPIDVIDIPLKKFLTFPKHIKNKFVGYRLNKPVNWDYQNIDIDPYILGIWLGDGCNDGSGFASADIEIIIAWCNWAYKNNSNIVHSGQYNYIIRNNNCRTNKQHSIFSPESNTYTCKGCINHRAPSIACASVDELILLIERDNNTLNYFSKGSCKEQLNIIQNVSKLKKLLEWKKEIVGMEKRNSDYNSSFRKLLKKNNLYNNKHIPKKYLINSVDVRLKLLAGFIDTTGGCFDKLNISIGQVGDNIHLIDELETLVRSLGIECVKHNIRENKKTNKFSQDLYMGEGVEQIPVLLDRKKCKNRKYGKKSKVHITVESIGNGNYYGFSVDGNNRFLLGDWISTHNCNNQQFLTENHWLNAMKDWDNVTVVDKVICDIIGGEKFIFAPYVYPGRFIEALNTLGKEWEDASCIFAHQEFSGCKMGAIISVEGDKWSLTHPHVVSGHIHSRQIPQENIYYPGSALQHAFGESSKNIIAYLTFQDSEYKREEIDLKLPRKKIVYKDIDEMEDYTIPEDTEDKIKVTVSGVYNQFKTFKKTKKYKDMLNKGVKVVFKPKKIDHEKKDEIIETEFNTVLTNIINNQKNPHLLEAFELIVNNKKINSEDIMFLK
jgi:DNA repair exonuclease SbcCD nuclease subunit